MASGPAGGVLRILRVGTVSLAAIGLAVAAHALTDGCVEPVGALLALGCAAPAAIALTARQRTAHAVLWWLVAVQVALHLILAAGCDSPLRTPSAALLAAHLLAATATAALLCGADAGLWTADRLRHLATRLFPRLLLPHGSSPRRPRPVVRRVRATASRWRSPTPVRRGPPVSVLAR